MDKNHIIILVVALASSSIPCKALDDPRSARILQYDFDNTGTGPYRFRFETSDGTKREEQGTLIHENTDHAAVIVRGSYSYTDRDGKVFTVRYTADENGFHPEGDHIKVPPFVPWVHHHGHDDGGSSIHDTGVNPGSNPVYLPSTPARPIQYIPSTTPSPDVQNQFVQSTLRPVLQNDEFIQTTARPILQQEFIQSTARPILQQEFIQTSPSPINVLAENVGISKNYIPTTPRNIPFNSIDPRIQRSIVNLIATGDGRGLNIADINSL